MNFIRFLFLLISCCTMAQEDSSRVLVIGNYSMICLEDEHSEKSAILPDSLGQYDVICFFSNATSALNEAEVGRVESFVRAGGGLYLGAENWPLQAESNQLTKRIYLKESFGEFEASEAQIDQTLGNLELEMETVPAGRSTVAFPMDYRLKVEAWVADQPLILSGDLDEGKVIIDGGYSRYYCDQRTDVTDDLWKAIISFLSN
jgi:hypothetical protein